MRIPCLAHIIQLSLKELLGHVKAEPKNSITDKEWSEDRSRSLYVNQQRGIGYTLVKVRTYS